MAPSSSSAGPANPLPPAKQRPGTRADGSPSPLPTPALPTHSGGIKRHGFHRGLMTHGSKSKREHGSIGMNSTPSRVFPGVKMPGQMGNVRTKITKLEVLMVDPERRAIVVKGAVPGKPGNVLEILPTKIVGVNV